MNRSPGRQLKIGENRPCLKSDWRYFEKPSLENFDDETWDTHNRQRAVFYREQQVSQLLRMLEVSALDPSYGYDLNNYDHCLQTATFLMKAGFPEEEIVVGLLHDIGFIVAPETHGEVAATIMKPYISDRNVWMLERHAIFQQRHCSYLDSEKQRECEQWRGHPHFEWTAEFVEKYDQNTIDNTQEIFDLAAFKPMVQRLFSKAPKFAPIF